MGNREACRGIATAGDAPTANASRIAADRAIRLCSYSAADDVNASATTRAVALCRVVANSAISDFQRSAVGDAAPVARELRASDPARLPLIVLSVMVIIPLASIPPPSRSAVLLEIVLWMIVSVLAAFDTAAASKWIAESVACAVVVDNAIHDGQRSRVGKCHHHRRHYR